MDVDVGTACTDRFCVLPLQAHREALEQVSLGVCLGHPLVGGLLVGDLGEVEKRVLVPRAECGDDERNEVHVVPDASPLVLVFLVLYSGLDGRLRILDGSLDHGGPNWGCDHHVKGRGRLRVAFLAHGQAPVPNREVAWPSC